MDKYIFKEVPPEHIDTRLELERTLENVGSENIYIFGNRALNDIGDNLISAVYELVNEDTISDTLYNEAYYLLKTYDGDMNKYIADCFSEIFVDWYSLTDEQRIVIDYNLLYCDNKLEATINILSEITGNNYDWNRLNGCVQGDWQNVIYNSDEIDSSMLERIEALYFNTADAWYCEELDITIYTNTLSPKFEISDQIEIPVEDILLQDFQGWERIAMYGDAE